MTSNPLTQTLITSLKKHRNQLHGKRVWLACSGGRDSLSMAKLCRELYDRGELPFLPQLLHVNHGMQDANEAWAKQVQNWASEHSMSCQILSVSLNDHSEQSARLARYAAMQTVMNCDDVLMLGHHSDDQVETVLMRLFNGTGVKGLGGMQEWTPKKFDCNQVDCSQHTQKTIYLWRPWLTVSRAQITDYAKSNNLNYIDDPTNVATDQIAIDQRDLVKDTINTHTIDTNANANANANDRAWLRSVLMPTIHERYPKASASILRTSQLLQDASDIIEEQVQTDLAQLIVSNAHIQLPSSMQSILDIDKLSSLSKARQSALIHHWLSPTSAELSPPSRLVNEVLDLCQRNNNDHQTCLYWNNTQHHCDIRRYKNCLYRLHSEWSAWLELPSASQTVSLNIDDYTSANTGRNEKKKYELKNSETKFNWQLHLSDTCVAQLLVNTQLDKVQPNCTAKLILHFQPLPRDTKLSLAGRVGRKSGKKLLQALNQPVFMRSTVSLVSIKYSNELLPLFIVTLNGIHPLQSPFTDTINELINSQQLTTMVLMTQRKPMC